MVALTKQICKISKADARRFWLTAQRLHEVAPFGGGAEATQRAVEHLGYVQIDTINVIERCHHHILFSRIPDYQRAHLQAAQSRDKSVFEYWTHALAYVPTRDLRFFLSAMRQRKKEPGSWFETVKPGDLRKVLGMIKSSGPLSIRDINDDVLVEKDHPWASRKPSKRALQLAFFAGELTVSERTGMLKSYDLMHRHFGWETRPKAASPVEVADYQLERALRSQGVVSLDSICYLAASNKAAVRAAIDKRMRRNQLVPVEIEHLGQLEHWAAPETLDQTDTRAPGLVHLLSPFDPLIIQRKRLAQLFDYDHRFEAYLPKQRRVFGYFALPVLIGDQVAAVIDLKTDRMQKKMLLQQWTWIAGESKQRRRLIEAALDRFGRFQLA